MTPHEVVVGPGPQAACITCDAWVGPERAVNSEDEAQEWADEHVHAWLHIEHRWARRCVMHRCACGAKYHDGERWSP